MRRLTAGIAVVALGALGVMLAGGTAGAAATVPVPCSGSTLADGAALVTAINGHGDGDTLSLSPGCLFTLDTTGFSSISDMLTVEGNGATITRSTAGATPAFGFFDVGSTGNLTVRDVTLSNGSGGDGGAIFSSSATVSIVNTTFSGNSGVDGGAVAAEGDGGTVTITGSTFIGNSASTDGGAIHNDVPLVVINSTFTQNTAPLGAAFYNNGGSATFVNATLSGNTTTSTGGALQIGSGTTTVTNTIVAANTGANCGTAAIGDGGYNLEDGTSCAFADHAVDASPALAPLASNGGPTQTMAIATASPAHDAANLTVCAAAAPTGADGVDQRGLSRASTGTETACDIGAFEVQAPTPTPTPSPTPVAPVPLSVVPAFTG